ncbi:MAG: hypothetical protein V5A33_02915 [Halobacteriales archaeon]
MRVVSDDRDRRLLLVKESGESSLVRDPESGETEYLPNDRLSALDGQSPLAAAAGAVPEAVRALATAVRDERTLGLLVELDDRGPLAVRTVMREYDLCESDVHGALLEFRAAGLVEETEVAGERGYELSAVGRDALDAVR